MAADFCRRGFADTCLQDFRQYGHGYVGSQPFPEYYFPISVRCFNLLLFIHPLPKIRDVV
jgi:hypothetical protein